MFWNGNYVVAREISSLLKDENVTLTQLIEADDILQECNAENKALVQFLTKPETIAELVSLITEEPSKNVELQSQYRFSSVACEILTSGIAAIADRLSGDTVQMHRLCDFINREPPLNPLLASFFSKTVKILLEQSPKQDWYSYHIISLRVLDFFKLRTDFLPNLFRHIGTSAIMDTFKYLIRLELFSKVILQWFETHQFLEVLIQMICGTYVPEELPAPLPPPPQPPRAANGDEKADTPKEINGEHGEKSEKEEAPVDDKGGSPHRESGADVPADAELPPAYAEEMREARVAAGRSANAANLMCEIILVGCYGEGCTTRPQSGAQLMAQCKSERVINLLLQSMFTSPLEFRRHAVVNGVTVLLASLQDDPVDTEPVNARTRRAVVAAVAPHLPLLHQILLQDPPPYPHTPQSRKTVGTARLQVATLIASLTGSPAAAEVPAALVALGTLPALLDLFFGCPGNNFLHAQTYRAISCALNNLPYQTLYAKHILIECDLLTRLMDTFEENISKVGGAARSGYMGHVVLLLELLQQVLDERLYELVGVPDELGIRWAQFKEDKMQPLFRETPLGGYHPADANYESEALSEANYDFNGVAATAVGELDELGADDNATDEVFDKYYSNYQYDSEHTEPAAGGSSAGIGERLSQKPFRPDMFEEDTSTEEWDWKKYMVMVHGAKNPKYPGEILDAVSPWESAGASGVGGGGGGGAEEGWAQFPRAGAAGEPGDKLQFNNDEDNDKFGSALPDEFVPYWDFSAQAAAASSAHTAECGAEEAGELQRAMQNLNVLGNDNTPPECGAPELVSNLLTAMSPDAFAGLASYAEPNRNRPLDNIEKTIEEQCEPMDQSNDDSPEERSPPGGERDSGAER